jgi:hypothetical protein
MNGNGQLKRQASPPPQPQRGIFVPAQYAPPATASERSLQINIDSEDDAKSVIQNLPAIKAAYEKAGDLTSVEFCIAESVAKSTENWLIGAIPWCRTYIKHIAPQPGNILFPLPAFKDLPLPPPTPKTAPISPDSTSPVNNAPQAIVKPQRPVRAEPAKT